MNRRRILLTGALGGAGCLAALAGGCGPGAAVQAQGAVPPRVEAAQTPDGGIQPQAAVDARGTIHLIYYKGEDAAGDLFYQRREAGSASWSAPLRVNSHPGSAVAAGAIRGGQLALGKGGRVHVVWNGSSQAQPRGPLNPFMPANSPYNGTPLCYTRLNDAGTAFEPQRNIMRSTFGLDGGAAVAADPQGSVFVVWHAQEGSGKGEESRKVWTARSTDDGKSFSREAPAWTEPTGVCPCCGSKAFADSKGRLYALYRMAAHRTERDMVLLTSTDHGKTFRGARIDPWPVDS